MRPAAVKLSTTVMDAIVSLPAVPAAAPLLCGNNHYYVSGESFQVSASSSDVCQIWHRFFKLHFVPKVT